MVLLKVSLLWSKRSRRWNQAGRKNPIRCIGAQLRIYAGILALEKHWPQASLQLTYLELDSNEVFLFREEATREVLVEFLHETVDEWFSWLIPHVDWIGQRNASTEKAPFPFTNFRAGQRELARSVYRAVQNKLNLFVEAPTGMGRKPWPHFIQQSRRCLSSRMAKFFILTAKTPGRLAAPGRPAKIARERRPRSQRQSDGPKLRYALPPDSSGCDPATCPFRKGYYDRYKPAMRELLATQKLDRDNISQVARKHQVLPFRVVIGCLPLGRCHHLGDYNYVFDPTVMLQRYFGEGRAKHVGFDRRSAQSRGSQPGHVLRVAGSR